MNNNNYILNLLGFQDENIQIDSFNEQDDIIIIEASIKEIPLTISCPSCSSNWVNIHAHCTRKISHIRVGVKKCIIIFNQIRFICRDCGKTFNLDCPIAPKSRRLSNILRKDIINETSYKQSFKDVSTRENLSETTISNEFKKEIHNYRCNLTEILCIDEFKASTICGTYALIIGDPVSGKILDILPSRQQNYLIYYFQTIPKEEKDKVKYVNTDLYEAYRSIVQAEFPTAIHIADRFHYTGLIYDAFNKIRIRLMKQYSTPIDGLPKEIFKSNLEYAEKLKKNYKLLVMNKYSKEDWYFDQIIKTDKFGNNKTMNNVIEEIVNKDTDLCEAYTLLQEFYRINKFSNEDNAKKNILEWCEKVQTSTYHIPELKKASLSIKSWIKEIANSFILNPVTHERMSNGFIEGKNNFCKVIKRIGFGFTDFDVLRNKIINCNDNVK